LHGINDNTDCRFQKNGASQGEGQRQERARSSCAALRAAMWKRLGDFVASEKEKPAGGKPQQPVSTQYCPRPKRFANLRNEWMLRRLV
jgi:hypothetical protein